jgi:PAS domain S-box-containing protein
MLLFGCILQEVRLIVTKPGVPGQESVPYAAFEDAPFEFWVRDADDRCTLQNAAAARRWGNLLGLRTEDATVSPEVLATWQETNRRAYAGELVQHEIEYVVGGEKRQYQCVIVPIRVDGEVRSIAGFNLDITDRKRAEEALRESERRLRAAMRIGRIGYLDWNLVTNAIRWSPETYRLFGYVPGAFNPTIETTVGMVPAEERDLVKERLKATILGASDYDLVHRMIRPDGHVIYVHSQSEVVRDENGKPLQMVGTIVDITERKLAEEALRISEERLKQALKAASASIWDWDIDTGETRWSRERFDPYGVVSDNSQTKVGDWRDLVHPEDHAAVRAAFREALEGRVPECRAEFRVPNASGRERWLLAIGRVKRALDGKAHGMTGISIDITERKQAEENLREVDRRRSEFLGVLSHELRNPLTPIRNNLHILQHAEPGGPQARQAIAVIDRQVGHLTRLIDDLLDVTRISSGKVRLRRTCLNLVDLVRRTVDDHSTLLANREVILNLPDVAVWIQGDATRLAQVLGNLLSNAAKFTPEGGKVSVSLTTEQGRAVLEVSDTGLGIDSETLARLFQPFTQGDLSLDRSRGGLGLGLALVKSLVEMHKGAVTARSEGPGFGASFSVWLPREEASTATMAPPSEQTAPRRRRKVLLIEDNAAVAESLAAVLQFSGHEVAIAFDGVTGLAKAREYKPDVILCDIGLPKDFDGYAVARALQQDATLANTYRIALTGYAQPKDRKKALEAGYHAHFAKPPDLAKLERLLAEIPSGSDQ